MNEIAKRSASERLQKAMGLEKLGPSDTARHLNILPQYVTMSKSEKYWPKMPKSAWDRILLWVNSGETLHHFKPPVELPPKEIARKPAPHPELTKEEKQMLQIKDIPTVKETVKPDLDFIQPIDPEPEVQKEQLIQELSKSVRINPVQQLTDTDARLKISLDIEINLVINGKKITL